MTIRVGEDAKNFGEIKLERNIRTFKVYDMPVDLINKFISYSKLHYDNQVWKVMEYAMNLILEEGTTWKVVVDKRLKILEDQVFQEEKKDTKPKTFGGGN